MMCCTEGPFRGGSSESSDASRRTCITLKPLLVQQRLGFKEGPQLFIQCKVRIHPARLEEDYGSDVHANNWHTALCIEVAWRRRCVLVTLSELSMLLSFITEWVAPVQIAGVCQRFAISRFWCYIPGLTMRFWSASARALLLLW